MMACGPCVGQLGGKPKRMRNTLLFTSFVLIPALATAQATNYPNGSVVDNFTVTDVDGNTHELYAYHAQGK